MHRCVYARALGERIFIARLILNPWLHHMSAKFEGQGTAIVVEGAPPAYGVIYGSHQYP